MKKNIYKTLLSYIAILILIFLPLCAFAGFIPCDGPQGIQGTPCDLSQVMKLINNVVSFFVFTLVPIIATGVILWAGMQMVANPENANIKAESKKFMWTVVIGVLIIFSSYFIVQVIVQNFVSDKPVGQELKKVFK